MRRRVAFLSVILLQLLALAGMIAQRVHLLRSGAPAMLQCRPVDPRSILSGHYVRLSFVISRFTIAELRRLDLYQERFREHDTIYVALERGASEPYHHAVAVSHDLERLRQRWPLIIRGTVRGDSDWSGSVWVRYGVEDYFVPQREGQRLEGRLERTAAEVAISRSGESALRRLLLDGHEVQFY